MEDRKDRLEKSDEGKVQTSQGAENTNNTRSKTGTSSSPIEIKQTQGGKFGVLTARHSPDPSGIITDANGEPVPLDKIIKTANTMSSMMMAHKIALEDDFRLEPGMDISGPLMSLSPIIGSSPSKGSASGSHGTGPNLQSKVKDIVHEAYWDLFKEELQSQTKENKEDRKFDISKQLLRDIRQKIVDLLLPQHSRLKQDIEDKLDSQILDQLSRVESLNLIEYAKYILDLLSKLCAPVRDEKLRELSETTDVVQLYRGIMELLELMRLDFANFTLNTFKPHIKAHSQEYEREKFNEILKQQKSIGIDGLEYTRKWLNRAIERVDAIHGLADLINESFNLDIDKEEINSTVMAQTDNNSKAGFSKEDKIIHSGVVNKVLNSAYCELLEWSSELQSSYPEALLFDEATFKQLGEQYKVLVLTSSILLTTFAFVSRFKLHENVDFKVLVKSHVIALLTASYENQSTATSEPKSTKTGSVDDSFEEIKLLTISTKLSEDIRQKLDETDKSSVDSFENQISLFNRQILDLQNSSNRIRGLARRRILEFAETILMLDVDHQQKKFSSKMAPPVNIPLGLNCLSDEITLTMAQLVKIIRYNRKVFFQHYQNIIVELISKVI